MGAYPPGCTQNLFDRETDRLNRSAAMRRRRTSEAPVDPLAMEKLRASLDALTQVDEPGGEDEMERARR